MKKNNYAETNQNSKKMLEIIGVRLYDPDDRTRVIDGVNQIAHQLPEGYHTTLYYNPVIQGEWIFYIRRPELHPPQKKSKPGLFLYELFREIGIVRHVLLQPFIT